MRGLVFLSVLLTPTLAQAACHHYSRWYYPWPQPRCGVAARVRAQVPVMVDRSWYVEIVLPDADARTQGIDHLKAILK